MRILVWIWMRKSHISWMNSWEIYKIELMPKNEKWDFYLHPKSSAIKHRCASNRHCHGNNFSEQVHFEQSWFPVEHNSKYSISFSLSLLSNIRTKNLQKLQFLNGSQSLKDVKLKKHLVISEYRILEVLDYMELVRLWLRNFERLINF